MSAFGLARQLDVPRHEAQYYIDRYFERFPGVQDYMESTREKAAAQGFIETLFGRRLHLPDIKARNGARRKAAERQAINAPMQGTAADIIKKAMINIQNIDFQLEDQKKQLEHFWDESIDPLKLPILHPHTKWCPKALKYVGWWHPPPLQLSNKNYTKYLQCVRI